MLSTQHYVATLPDGSEHPFQIEINETTTWMLGVTLMPHLQTIVDEAGCSTDPLPATVIPVQVNRLTIEGTVLRRTPIAVYGVTPSSKEVLEERFNAACLALQERLPRELREPLCKFLQRLAPRASFKQRYEMLATATRVLEQTFQQISKQIQDAHDAIQALES